MLANHQEMQILMPACSMLVFRDAVCQPAEKQRCENLTFRNCYFHNLKRLDTGEPEIISEKLNSPFIIKLKMFFSTFRNMK